MSRRKFILDSLLNILSTALPLLVLQLISLPIAASQLGPNNFGILITIISILTVIGFPIGNTLNNIRLLRNDLYIKEGLKGDFNLLLLGSSLVSILSTIIFSIIFIDDLNYITGLFFILIVIFSILKEYLIVSYRISLNFRGILINNIILSLGYFLGTGLFYLTGYWELIYLVGLVLSLLYIVITTNLLTEPFLKTNIFKTTMKEYFILYGSNLLKNFSSYADKIILLPLLGPKNVSIYYAASIIGKIMLILFNPINNVILSYIVKIEKIERKSFMKAFSMVGIIGVLGYILSITISPYFLNFFYPLWGEKSLELVYITSGTAIISILSTVLHPFNLRYNQLKWQIYMSASNLIFYLIAAYFLVEYYGLIGFTLAVLLSEIYRFLFQFAVYLLSKNRFS